MNHTARGQTSAISNINLPHHRLLTATTDYPRGMSNQSISNKSCTLAAPPVLASRGATALPDGNGIEYKGWTFRTSHSTISGERDLVALAGRLAILCGAPVPPDDVIVLNNAHLHLPAMIFGQNALEIVHSSGNLKFEFKAEESLHSWVQQHSTPGGLSHVPQVPYADRWMRQAASDPAAAAVAPRNAVAVGSTVPSRHPGRDGDSNPPSPPLSQSEGLVVEGVPEPIVPEHWDWTFSSEYCCSLHLPDGTSSAICATALSGLPGGRNGALFKPAAASGINVDMLRQQQEILLYDEIVLFQDDLQDCGDVSLEVKIRVMPTCWFVLCRFFKRVDGSVACIRDSRLFHEFGSSKVYMDLLWQEQNLQPPPASSEATVRPTSALGSLPAVPPNQQRDVNAWSRVLPDVTLKSKVHKNFELDLVA